MNYFKKMWGEALGIVNQTRRLSWVDGLVLLALAGIIFGLTRLGQEWGGVLRPAVHIDLSPRALPRYAFFSLVRALLAYVMSLLFSLGYGYWAAKDHRAERILIPLLDILQSIPVLGFMPGLVLALLSIFPHSNIGLELAAVLMIFTGQAWNMTFSFYYSLKSIPNDQMEVSSVYQFNAWQRFKWVELPAATMGLVWNSMMSMAGGWFFLMVSEAFVLGQQDFRLPGLGSYMSVAVSAGDFRAMGWAVAVMVVMIVILDQVLWRPLVVWAQKFRSDDGGQGEEMNSWVLDWLRRSRILSWMSDLSERILARVENWSSQTRAPILYKRYPIHIENKISLLLFVLLLCALSLGSLKLLTLLGSLSLSEWLHIVGACLLTLLRVMATIVIGTLWVVPVGLWIGLSPRLSTALQPVVQVMASFPAPMIFPVMIAIFLFLNIPLGWGSIVLMLLGTQWYILFNVIAGAMAIPSDLKEVAYGYRSSLRQRFWYVYLPAIFPYLVTGWVTASGGAWNASIISEYVTFKGRAYATTGIGALISQSAEHAAFPHLAASLVILSGMVVLLNRSLWRKCFTLAQERFVINR